MGLKINYISQVLFFFIFIQIKIFSQVSYPAENKNWRWLLPEDNKIYSLAVEGDTVWAGSDVGLFKVNVKTGESINFNRINSPLPDNWVLSISIDENHCKWIGTYGKGVLKINGDGWEAFSPKYFGIYGMNIRDMKIEKNILWIATWGDGVIKLNTLDYTFERFTEANSGLLYDAIYDIEIDSQGAKWFATMEGICKYDGNSWTSISSSGNDFKNTISSISINKNDQLWALFEKSTIGYYDRNEWKKYKIPDSMFWGGLADLNTIYSDEFNNIWIGSLDGLIKFDGNNWTLFNEKNCGYSLDIIECIQPDMNGKLWLGGWDGLFCLDDNEFSIHHTGNTSIPNMNINSIRVDINGKVWIATDAGLASVYKNHWRVYTKSNSPLPGDQIKQVIVDQKNNKWISVRWKGIVKYDDLRNDWQIYDTLNSGLQDNYVADLSVDKDGQVWIGTRKGLSSFNGRNWKNYNQEDSTLPFRGISYMRIDEQNKLWLISSPFDLRNRGDKIVNFDGKHFSVVEPQKDFDKFNNASVHGFAIDQNNVKWFATANNLIWFDDKEWNYADRNKLQIIFSCLGEIYCEKDFIWICSTMGGLIRYNGSKFMIWNNENSFLPDNIDTVTKDSFGNLWIGTQNKGIIIYNPGGISYE